MAIGAVSSGSSSNQGASKPSSASSAASQHSPADAGHDLKTSHDEHGVGDARDLSSNHGSTNDAHLAAIEDKVELSADHNEAGGADLSHLFSGLAHGLADGWDGDTSKAGDDAHMAYVDCQIQNNALQFFSFTQDGKVDPNLRLDDCNAEANQVFTKEGGQIPNNGGGGAW